VRASGVHELPREGPHRATVVEVQDAGLVASDYNDAARHVLDITFRIEDECDSDGEPMFVVRRVTNVVNKHSMLGRMLAALGIPVDFKATTKRFSGVDEAILGKTLNIKIQQIKKGNATFADVVGFPKTITTHRQVATFVDDVLASVVGRIA
jgi:hypothetical protein